MAMGMGMAAAEALPKCVEYNRHAFGEVVEGLPSDEATCKKILAKTPDHKKRAALEKHNTVKALDDEEIVSVDKKIPFQRLVALPESELHRAATILNKQISDIDHEIQTIIREHGPKPAAPDVNAQLASKEATRTKLKTRFNVFNKMSKLSLNGFGRVWRGIRKFPSEPNSKKFEYGMHAMNAVFMLMFIVPLGAGGYSLLKHLFSHASNSQQACLPSSSSSGLYSQS